MSINISTEAKMLLMENRKTLFKADLILADDTEMSIAGDDVMANTVSFSDSVSSSSSFDIGAAIINSLSLTLNNYDDRFSLYDFTGAKIKACIGIPLETTEWITKGYYTVDKPSSLGNTIPLVMLDNMSKFEKPFKNVTLTFPTTIGDMLQSVCIYCGVILDSITFPNHDMIIPERPDDSNLSCLDIVSAIAQLAGCWARINRLGNLSLAWYDTDAFGDESDSFDGGTFLTRTAPYSDGDNLDGGDFTYSGTEDSADGGGFTYGNYFSCYAHKSLSVGTDDITITGIKVVVDSDNEYAVGEDGYVLEISGNPLITATNMEAVAQFLGNKIVGMVIRPFNSSSLSDPTVEAGDAVRVTDSKGNYYDTYITTCSYKFGNYETFACNAETVSARNATDYSPITKAVEQARKDTQKAIGTYDQAVRNMCDAQANALGFYETFEEDLNGSRITYMHDQPLLAESTIIWKKTIDGFFVSTDGGVTWGGMTADLNIVAKVLTVIGINADWINAGTITGRTISGGSIKGTAITGGTISGKSSFSYVGNGGSFTVNNNGIRYNDNGAGSQYLGFRHEASQGDPDTASEFHVGGARCASFFNSCTQYLQCLSVDIVRAANNASDFRLKKDFKRLDKKISDALIRELKPYQFQYKNIDNEINTGFLAQEVISALKRIGIDAENEHYRMVDKNCDGYYKIDYNQFVPHLVNVVQTQQSEIDELKQQVKFLMEKVGG